jgi:hypothetical protein
VNEKKKMLMMLLIDDWMKYNYNKYMYHNVLSNFTNSVRAFVPERSKGVHSSCTVFALVGSNPTECTQYLLLHPLTPPPPNPFLTLLTILDPSFSRHFSMSTSSHYTCMVHKLHNIC